MDVEQYHPHYTANLANWRLMRDTFAGEDAVKAAGKTYLRPTQSMIDDGANATGAGAQRTEGALAYDAYKDRAVFHELVSTGIEAMLGMMHLKPPEIQLPTRLEPMLESCTILGEPIEALLRKINLEQLTTGRVGALLDIPAVASAATMPYVVLYGAESIINWDVAPQGDEGRKSFSLVVLDESGQVRRGFEWIDQKLFRILTLGQFAPEIGFGTGSGYLMGVEMDGALQPVFAPSIGGRGLDTIPFVIIGSKDLDPCPDKPPMIPLARKSIALYRLEADYRNQLFQQSQDTLVVIGLDPEQEVKTGANAVMYLGQGADAKYVGVSSQGLPEMRQAVENEKMAAAELGAAIIDAASSGSAASGEALSVRVAARTANLASIARAGAEGLQTLLRKAAEWVGADPELVLVEPNLDFGDLPFTADDLTKLMAAKAQGAPISNRTIHAIMRSNDFTSLDYKEELDEIESEAGPDGLPAGQGGQSGPNENQNQDGSGNDTLTGGDTPAGGNGNGG